MHKQYLAVRKSIKIGLLVLLMCVVGTQWTLAAKGHGEEAAGVEESGPKSLMEVGAALATGLAAVGTGLKGIGAGLAIGLGAVGCGIAQAQIGAAGIGSIAENPKSIGIVIGLLVLPETLVILGFVISYLLISQ